MKVVSNIADFANFLHPDYKLLQSLSIFNQDILLIIEISRPR